MATMEANRWRKVRMRFIDREGFEGLLRELVGRGYELIGPTVRDGAIVLDRIEGVGDLPRAVTDEQGPGTYRVLATENQRTFAFSHGPDSAKRFLFPAREIMSSARRIDGHLKVVETDGQPGSRYAFVGLRACDLHAVQVQDRVFMGGAAPDKRYEQRREDAFFIGVNCERPGETCFCASMGSGPRCTTGFDLALTELHHGFVVEVGTSRGREVFDAVGSREATAEEVKAAEAVSSQATEAMGRRLDTSDIQGLLYRNREHPEWKAIADICLACGNCTAVCPTCFCHDVVDATDLLSTTATRTREWASCFSEEFSHTAGHDVRTSREARYRQWLTHKFATWIDQFGTSGCVGCGRCITWCPVGIDVTREIEAIRAADGAVRVVTS
jgi:sulfhydrogenase subunit beta (sulfur reductase)